MAAKPAASQGGGPYGPDPRHVMAPRAQCLNCVAGEILVGQKSHGLSGQWVYCGPTDHRQYTNVKNHRQCIAYKTTLLNRETSQNLRKIGINALEVLAVTTAFLYHMHWRPNVNDALSVRM